MDKSSYSAQEHKVKGELTFEDEEVIFVRELKYFASSIDVGSYTCRVAPVLENCKKMQHYILSMETVRTGTV